MNKAEKLLLKKELRTLDIKLTRNKKDCLISLIIAIIGSSIAPYFRLKLSDARMIDKTDYINAFIGFLMVFGIGLLSYQLYKRFRLIRLKKYLKAKLLINSN